MVKGNATFQIEVDENKDLKLFFTKKNPVKEVQMVKKKKRLNPYMISFTITIL